MPGILKIIVGYDDLYFASYFEWRLLIHVQLYRNFLYALPISIAIWLSIFSEAVYFCNYRFPNLYLLAGDRIGEIN